MRLLLGLLLMATYGQYEPTRQGAQPVELYQFYWGNASVTGTSASQPPVSGCGEFSVPVRTDTTLAGDSFTSGVLTDIAGRALETGAGTWTKIGTSSPIGMDAASGVFGAVRANGTDVGSPYVVTGLTMPADAGVRASAQRVVSVFPPGFGVLLNFSPTDYTGYELKWSAASAGNAELTLIEFTAASGREIRHTNKFPLTFGDTHTIGLHRIGTRLYAELDGVLQFTVVDTTHMGGFAGLSMHNASNLGSKIVVTDWSVVTASPPASLDPATGLSPYVVDGFDGVDDVDITGRIPDGGGQTCLQNGVWQEVGTKDAHLQILGNRLRYQAAGATSDVRTAVLTGVPNLGNDYTIAVPYELTDDTTLNTAWVSVAGRYASGAETGYHLFLQPDVTGTDGLVYWFLYSDVAGVTSTLLDGFMQIENIIGASHTIRFSLIGTRLTGYWDNELLVTTADSTHSTGYPGIQLYDDHPYPDPPDGATIAVDRFQVCATSATQPCGQIADALLVLNYTTADVPIVFRGDTYEPFVGIRTSFNSGSRERTAAEIDLRCPFDHPIATLARQGVPRGPVGCTVYRLDRQDLSDDAAAIPMQGQLTRIRELPDRWSVVTIGNLGTLLTRKLPRMLTQRSCPHVFGGPFCQFDLSTITHADLPVVGFSGRTITVSGASALATAAGNPAYFQEGVLITGDGLREFIEQQDGDTLTLKQIVPGLDIDTLVTLQGGCTHTATACDRHANIQHFGGEIGIPDQNPSTGAGLVGPGSTVENV